MRAVGAGEDAAVAEAVDDVGSLVGSGFAGVAIEDQIYAKEKSGAAPNSCSRAAARADSSRRPGKR